MAWHLLVPRHSLIQLRALLVLQQSKSTFCKQRGRRSGARSGRKTVPITLQDVPINGGSFRLSAGLCIDPGKIKLTEYVARILLESSHELLFGDDPLVAPKRCKRDAFFGSRK